MLLVLYTNPQENIFYFKNEKTQIEWENQVFHPVVHPGNHSGRSYARLQSQEPGVSSDLPHGWQGLKHLDPPQLLSQAH